MSISYDVEGDEDQDKKMGHQMCNVFEQACTSAQKELPHSLAQSQQVPLKIKLVQFDESQVITKPSHCM